MAVMGYLLFTSLLLTVGYFAAISEFITVGYHLAILGLPVALVVIWAVGRYLKRNR